MVLFDRSNSGLGLSFSGSKIKSNALKTESFPLFPRLKWYCAHQWTHSKWIDRISSKNMLSMACGLPFYVNLSASVHCFRPNSNIQLSSFSIPHTMEYKHQSNLKIEVTIIIMIKQTRNPKRFNQKDNKNETWIKILSDVSM